MMNVFTLLDLRKIAMKMYPTERSTCKAVIHEVCTSQAELRFQLGNRVSNNPLEPRFRVCYSLTECYQKQRLRQARYPRHQARVT